MKDGFAPVANQNVKGSISNNSLKLEKENYELQQYSRRNNVEILGLPDIFTGDRLTEKVVELCNDVRVMVEVRNIEARHRLFQKGSNNQLPKRTIARFVNPRISYLNEILVQRYLVKLGLPMGTQIYFNANLCGYYKKLWGYV